jgi:hypothetical protein
MREIETALVAPSGASDGSEPSCVCVWNGSLLVGATTCVSGVKQSQKVDDRTLNPPSILHPDRSAFADSHAQIEMPVMKETEHTATEIAMASMSC